MPTSSEFLPKYPIYIISKGRYKTIKTSGMLDELGVPYRVAVEQHEFDSYASKIGEERLIKLPWSNHGMGSGPARNFCWEHSIKEGHLKHHILDDNLYHIFRLTHNRRNRVKTDSIIRSMEDFVDRYENVGIAGPQYTTFARPFETKVPLKLNKRVMSWLLIDNSLPFRWRGKYNEDVDLYLRTVKTNYYCTMLFYYFCVEKATNLRLKGGNTEELYGVGTYDKSKMLYQLHPDVVRLTKRYGRDHHEVNIKPFQHIMPILKKGIVIPDAPNEYGMCYAEGWGTDNLHKEIHEVR